MVRTVKPPTRLAGGETVRFATLREALMPSSTRVPAHSCVTAVTPSYRASACGKAHARPPAAAVRAPTG